MAKYEHLQLYKAFYDFLLYFAKVMINYQREYKYTVGERLLNMIIDSIVIIYKANSSEDNKIRLGYILEIQEKVQYINILLRLSCGVNAISKEKYNNCCNFMFDIEKQLAGRKNYVSSKESINNDSKDNEVSQLRLM